jgi:cell cycle checkpoint protein
MSAQPLHAIWDAAASNPYVAAVPKETQFSVGFFLLLGAIILSGLFGLSASIETA